MKKLTINKKIIKNFGKPFIIAEACINHEGNLKNAKKMIREAKKAGVDCIKFQIHNLNNEMLKKTPKSNNFKESLWDTLERTNFNISQQYELKKYCEKNKIIYLCTPFSKEGADELESINVKFYKVGSGELTNLPLIEHIAKKKKPMIISTGMSEMIEIEETVKLVKKIKTPFALTHCTSIYPCPPKLSNIRAIPLMVEKFKVPVGLSDHTNSIYTSFGAIAHGAPIIEKHFTLDKTSVGPDHASSIEPSELKELVHGANIIFEYNNKIKKIFKEEKQIIAWARESVVTEKNIKKNEIINEKMVWVKRPAPKGNVIAAKYLSQVIGKKAKKNIPANVQLKWNDIK